MLILYLTKKYAVVHRDGEGCLLVKIPEKRRRDGTQSSPARKEHIPLIKIDQVVVLA